ncbi:MAG: hypothetical protein ACRDWW_06495 [Acidimicrobiales bacterium]
MTRAKVLGGRWRGVRTARWRQRSPGPAARTGAAARRERGSVLVLVPAGLLVLFLLAGIAVDSAAAYLGQQQLRDTLAAAANDAATAGLSGSSFYQGGAVRIDEANAARTVCLDVVAQSGSDLHGVQLWMGVTPTTVRLSGAATVDAVFGRLIPGFGHRHVRASASATVTSGNVGPAPARGSPAATEAATPALAPLRCT